MILQALVVNKVRNPTYSAHMFLNSRTALWAAVPLYRVLYMVHVTQGGKNDP